MAVELEFINIIIPIAVIEKLYVGGFNKYKKDNLQQIGKTIWFDDYIVREGAMNPKTIQEMVKIWESYGLTGITDNHGIKEWSDLCVVDFIGGLTLSCEWLNKTNNYVFHVNDRLQKKVNRTNMVDNF